MSIQQCAEAVLLVRPAAFAYNSETAASNAFQQSHEDDRPRVPMPWRSSIRWPPRSQAAGVTVCVAEDSLEPVKPDAVFPNNWISWHRDGTVVLYPMLAINRRAERGADLIEWSQRHTDFERRRLLDLSRYESEGRFLEGTGSLVLDHVRRVAFACRSARTDESLVIEWARHMDYEPIVFDAHTAATVRRSITPT